MTWKTWALIVAALVVASPPCAAQPSAAESCLERCKSNTEQCVKDAGDDAERLSQCTTEALSCIESCKGS
jgi:hypothetical protein